MGRPCPALLLPALGGSTTTSGSCFLSLSTLAAEGEGGPASLKDWSLSLNWAWHTAQWGLGDGCCACAIPYGALCCMCTYCHCFSSAALGSPDGCSVLQRAPRARELGMGSRGVGSAGGTPLHQVSAHIWVLVEACFALHKSFKLISTKSNLGFDIEYGQ